MTGHASMTYTTPRGLVGGTPLVQLNMDDTAASSMAVYAKLEMCNLGGSMKDRAAFNMVTTALNEGLVKPGGQVVESSSGNMAVGLARACLFFKLQFSCFVDERTNKQTLKLLTTLGANVHVVRTRDLRPGESLLSLRLSRVADFLKKHPDTYWTNQYANPHNAEAYELMVKEIEQDLPGNTIDYLFCATGTCGTIRGCADYLRARGKSTQIIAVDAVGSSIFGQLSQSRHIPGHGSSIKPALFTDDMYDKVVHVSEKESIDGCRYMLENEGVLAGGSSGAVVSAFRSLASQLTGNVVLILADGGERYIDTVYNQDWANSHNLG